MESRAPVRASPPRRHRSHTAPGGRTGCPDDGRSAVALGIATSVAVVATGLSPTGAASTDVFAIGVAVTAAVWAGSAAPWWAALALAAGAAAAADTRWAIAAGVLGIAVAALTRLARAGSRTVTAAAVALGVLAFAGAGTFGSFGLSTAIGVAAVGVVAGLGVAGLPAHERRRLLIGSAGVVGTCTIALIGLTGAAIGARGDLTRGHAATSHAIDAMRDGRFDDARAQFSLAATSFRRADVTLRRPWAQPARLVPVLAQHRAAGEHLTGAAASTSRSLEVELGELDLDALRVEDGRIDVDAVGALREPLDRVNATLDRLGDAVRASESPWLVRPLQQSLDGLAEDLAEQRAMGSTASRALDVAPAVLGRDGPRRYFVMFTTPAEARGLGGFMGNYAELTIDDGNVSLTAFGRHKDLTLAGAADRRLVDAPGDWLARYGTFGFTNGPSGTTGSAPWANVTMSPHFPSTAQVVAELYPQSGGRQVDGVFSVDVMALQRLVGLVGPIEIDGAPVVLDGSNTADFLLVGQYEIGDASERTDLLETVARSTLDRVLGGSAPHAVDLGRALAPMVRERRVMAWSADTDEQLVFGEVGLDGGLLRDLGDADGIAITVDNASGNKIDTFLEREFDLFEDVEMPGTYELTIRLRNDPPLDLPDYVVGNLVDLPRGSSRLFVSVHTTMRLVSAHDQDGAIGLQPSTEAGFAVYSGYVDIPAGGIAEWRLVLERSSGDAPIVIDPQPLVLPARVAIAAANVGCTDRWAQRAVIDGRVDGSSPAVGCSG